MTSFAISAADRVQLIETFVAETEETLARLEELLLQLEQSPDDEVLHEIFRAAHTIKGNAACLQFEELTALAHAAESLLERMRDDEIHVTPALISRLLDAVDAFRDLTARSLAGDAALTDAQKMLIADLAAFASVDARSSAATVAVTGSVSAHTPRAQKSLRVPSMKLDRMLNLTGEIAIARGHIRQLVSADTGREGVLDSLYELDRLNAELQELVMHARLVPLGPALRPFHRIVRDVAAIQNKSASLVIDGGDVEVDTAVVENLKDPMTHMIRNAIDHGIETPEARVACGKPAVATIRISAAQENGGIVIRFSDDGLGIDESRIASRARTLGLDVDRLSRQEILNVIFVPGFTTAKKVSALSGRGVGMDIVRRNVEALRGSVSVASEPNRGTTITIRLPLTVAVIEGFGIRVGDATYIIPIESVVECSDLPSDAAPGVCGVLNVRGEPLPFLRLRQFFGSDAAVTGRQNVVVVQNENARAGIVVDELLGCNQTVMKPLGQMLQRVPGIAGSSILGNGRVALILDLHEIVRRASELVART